MHVVWDYVFIKNIYKSKIIEWKMIDHYVIFKKIFIQDSNYVFA